LKIVSPKFIKYCLILGIEKKKIPICLTVDDASCHLSCYTSTHASIWHRYGYMAPQRQWGHDLELLGSRDIIGHVTIRLPGVDFLRVAHSDHASISSTVMEIWPFEVLPGRLLKEQRSVVGLSVLNTTLISYTPLHYVRNVARKE